MAMDRLKNSEFIQSIIRLCIGALTFFYISSGIESGYFDTSHEVLKTFTIVFFSLSLLNIFSILWIAESTPRRYSALIFDIASTTFSSYLTGGINSVYVLVYLWIYIGYGTRYGLRFLGTAVVLTFIGYNLLLLTENAWHLLTLEAIAFLLLIIALPAYLYSLQKRLMHSADIATQANNAKTEFLSNMTHQIRTPIGGIVGMVNLLNKTNLDHQQKQYLQALSQSSHALQDIIDDVIDFSSIEKGKVSFNQSHTSPRLLIDSLIHSLAPLSYERDIELSCYIDKSIPDEVNLDSQRFRQLLSNLIRYAIEHSDQQDIYLNAYSSEPGSNNSVNSCIEIQFTQNLNIQHLTSNQIPETNDALPLRISYQLTRLMDGLFEIHYSSKTDIRFNLRFNWEQLNPNITQDLRFAGKRVLIFEPNENNKNVLEKYCHQLGMKVYATTGHDNLIAHIIWSQQKNKPFDTLILGEDRRHRSCYELALRIRGEAHCNTPILYASYLHNIEQIEIEKIPAVEENIIKPISLNNLKKALYNILNEQAHTIEPANPKQRSLNILVAEDNEVNASVIYSHLTDLGHNADIATDGNTALYAMHKHHYDLVFMDLNMPNMDGLETTRQWRKLEKKHSHLPIIALTAKATEEDRKHCFTSGMDDFMAKPVQEEQLIAVIQKLFS
jgi:CheY-like chemotaxis protein/signal transduction histidine kinase